MGDASHAIDLPLLLISDKPFDIVSEEKNRSTCMTTGSQYSGYDWLPVRQLMHAGWYRAGAPWDSNSMEWGLRFGHNVDAETALRRWITAVDEDRSVHEVTDAVDDCS